MRRAPTSDICCHDLVVIFTVSFLVLGLAGCGGQALQAPPDAEVPLSAAQRVLIIREKLPTSVQYEVVGHIAVRKHSYGSTEWALARLAAEAREAGANAVMEVEISFAPSWAGWATPHGKGTAIRIISPTLEDVYKMPTLRTEWH